MVAFAVEEELLGGRLVAQVAYDAVERSEHVRRVRAHARHRAQLGDLLSAEARVDAQDVLVLLPPAKQKYRMHGVLYTRKRSAFHSHPL